MRVWTTSGRNIALAAALFFAVTPTAYAVGPLQFTEVMYDAPGADTGREWLEITNTGQGSVDITGYKFFESGVNHSMSVMQGTTTLAAGESVIIAANTAKFLTDYPSYSGTLFKSSFSLTNIGESVELRDKKLGAVAALTYSSAMGAAGDGNSLHVSMSGTLVPGAPNPGSSAPTKSIIKAAPLSLQKLQQKNPRLHLQQRAPPRHPTAQPTRALSLWRRSSRTSLRSIGICSASWRLSRSVLARCCMQNPQPLRQLKPQRARRSLS